MRPRRPLGDDDAPDDDITPDDDPVDSDAPTRVGPSSRVPPQPEEEYRDVRDVPPSVREEVAEERRAGWMPDRIWPWLLLLLLLVVGGLLAAYFLTRGGDKKTVPQVVGANQAAAVSTLQNAGFETTRRYEFSAKAKGTVTRTDPASGTKAKKGSTVVVFVSKGPSVVTVPNLIGLSEASAASKLTAAGLKPNVFRVPSNKPEGTVIAQNPQADQQLQRGQAVRINVSQGVTQTTTTVTTQTTTTQATTTSPATTATTTGATTTTPTTTSGSGTTTAGSATTSAAPPPSPPATPPATVPDVTGETEQAAAAKLKTAGLLADSYPVSSSDPGGTVEAQKPGSGTLPAGSVVRLNVSIGSGARPQRKIPDVKNLPEATARARLRSFAFTVRAIYRTTKNSSAKGRVIFQTPGAGTTARTRFQVTIYVGRAPGATTGATTTG